MRIVMLLIIPTLLYADTLSIADAAALALEKNYQIRIARIDQEKADNTRKLKYGALLPTARVDGSMTYTNTDAPPPSPSETMIYTAAVSGNWTLFDGFRMFYAFNQVDDRARLIGQASRHTIESSVAGVITAYHNLLALSAMLDAVQHQLDVSRALLNKLQNRYEFGGTTKRALLRQQVLVNADSSAVSALELDVIQARHSLNLALGRSPNEPVTATPDTLIAPPQHDAAHWLERAKTHNAGLKIAEIGRNIAESDYGIAKAAFWPFIAANGSYARSFGDNELTRFSAGLTLTWPLLNGFRTLTAAQNAALDIQIAEHSLEQQQKQLEALIFAQYERRQNAYRQIRFERQAVRLAEQSLQVSQEQYTLGGITDVQLREAQLALTQVQVRFQSALFLYKITSMQLEQLAGALRVQ